MSIEENIAPGPIPPRADEERDSGQKDDGAGVDALDVGQKKFLCRIIPPGRRGTGPRQKDDGVGVNAVDVGQKKFRCMTYTPTAVRKRDCGGRTMGWVLMQSMSARRNFAV
jgi:hypothetical protein